MRAVKALKGRLSAAQELRRLRRTCPHPEEDQSRSVFDAKGEMRWCYRCRNQAAG